MTQEILGEMKTAKEILKNQGTRSDLTSGHLSRSWASYCRDIGLEVRTADRWLSAFTSKTAHVSHNSGENEWYTPL